MTEAPERAYVSACCAGLVERAMGPLEGLARFISAMREGEGEGVELEGLRLRRSTKGMRGGATLEARRAAMSVGVVPGVDLASSTSLARWA